MDNRDYQLRQVLSDVTQGAEVMRYMALAMEVIPNIWVSANFLTALTTPLRALDGLLGDSPLPVRHRAARRLPLRLVVKTRGRRPMKRTLAERELPNALPKPPDISSLGFLSSVTIEAKIRSISEASACRALLLEIVRRAAFDWVLYRSSSKLINRQLAEGAHSWLFIEEPDSSLGLIRHKSGKSLTSFVAICELLDLDPDSVRERIKLLTRQEIMNAGRPAERRKHKTISEDALHTDDLRVFDVDVDCLPIHDPLYSSYATDS